MSLSWGLVELQFRNREDGDFPSEPLRGTESWAEFADMKRRRSWRRKAVGFSRSQALYWIATAARVEMKEAA